MLKKLVYSSLTLLALTTNGFASVIGDDVAGRMFYGTSPNDDINGEYTANEFFGAPLYPNHREPVIATLQNGVVDFEEDRVLPKWTVDFENDLVTIDLNWDTESGISFGNGNKHFVFSDVDFIGEPNRYLTGLHLVSNSFIDCREEVETYLCGADDIETLIPTLVNVSADSFHIWFPHINLQTIGQLSQSPGPYANAGIPESAAVTYRLQTALEGDQSTPVPIPSPLALLCIGLAAIGYTRKIAYRRIN